MAELKGYNDLHRRFVAIGATGRTAPMMRALGLNVVRHQKLLVRRKTGHTGRTVKLESVTDDKIVTSAGGAAIYLEKGTAPHTITPRAAKALRFAASAAGTRLSGAVRAGAAVVFAKRVRHPGTKAQPFMVPGAEKAIREEGFLGEIVKRWNGAA